MGCSTSKETVTTGQQGHADYGGDYPFADKLYSSSVKVKDPAHPSVRADARPERQASPLARAGRAARP